LGKNDTLDKKIIEIYNKSMDIFDYISTIVNTYLSIVLTIISLYFCYKQISHRIEISFSESYSGYSKPRINNIVLYNKRNRIEIIKSISIIIDKKLKYEIKKFENPVILNPYECVKIETEELTEYYLDNRPIDFMHIILDDNYFFELTTNGKKIIYFPKKLKWTTKVRNKEKYKQIATVRKIYNGVIINDSVLYAILYTRDGVHKTAFINKHGIIGGDWNFSFNVIPVEYLDNKENIMNLFFTSGIKSLVENIVIDKL
jgi:hypothetical protein